MKLYFGEGVRKQHDTYVFDYTNDLQTDIIDLTSIEIYKKSHFDNVYWFGYKFKDSVSSKERTDFIDSIKGLSSVKIDDGNLYSFIVRPLRKLEQQINLEDVSCIVYPRSDRSDLVRKIMGCVRRVFPHETPGISFEIVKNLPSKISFDWKSFLDDFEGSEYSLTQIQNYVDNELIPKIHQLDYFSIAKNVKPKYRPYIQNYFVVEEMLKESLSVLQDGKILIVDDILTSGASIDEIIKQIRSLSTKNEIYIFTLIGR